MRLIPVYLLSWIAGLIAYVASLGSIRNQTLSGNDLTAVLSGQLLRPLSRLYS